MDCFIFKHLILIANKQPSLEKYSWHRNITPVGRMLTRNRKDQGIGYLQDEDSAT